MLMRLINEINNNFFYNISTNIFKLSHPNSRSDQDNTFVSSFVTICSFLLERICGMKPLRLIVAEVNFDSANVCQRHRTKSRDYFRLKI